VGLTTVGHHLKLPFRDCWESTKSPLLPYSAEPRDPTHTINKKNNSVIRYFNNPIRNYNKASFNNPQKIKIFEKYQMNLNFFLKKPSFLLGWCVGGGGAGGWWWGWVLLGVLRGTSRS
jgi:hypothetical protein